MRTQRARYPGAPIHSKGRSGHPRVVRAIKILSLCVAVVMVLGAGYLGWVGWHRSWPIALPVPTGTYPVGRRMFDWTDPSRRDNLRSPSGTARELSVWLWYPATLIPGSSRATYAPGAWQALHMAAPVGFFEGPLDNMATHSSDNAPIAAGPFPVVILEPGMGLAALQLTALAESVASHGYVVAGITPTDSANVTVIHNRVVPATTLGNPPDIGRDASTADHILRAWVGDAQFTRSQLGRLNLAGPLASHLTLTHASYVGHSFGGAAALQACHDDRQCAGAVDLDGTQFGDVVHAGSTAPFMILGGANSCVTGTCTPSGAADSSARQAAQSLLAASDGPRWCYEIDRAAHFNFTDVAAWYLAPPLRAAFPLGPIDGRRGLLIEASYVTAFLDSTHSNAPQPLLEDTSREYPEVHRLPGR